MSHHVSLREVLGRAIHEVWCAEEGLCLGRPADIEKASDLATELQTQLRQAGYAIHANDGRCVRPRVGELGRPMSDAERIALGADREAHL